MSFRQHQARYFPTWYRRLSARLVSLRRAIRALSPRLSKVAVPAEDVMELLGPRIRIRPWQRHDDELADEWPPYNDPLEPLWNLPRPYSPGSGGWETYFDSPMRRTWA